ncbi:hypothetical protein BB561_004055 [Smittium simulii]|uniref:Inositol polyphosphate-related phosphatase domain-containing protein n=1 Tax=Smittium simulii TaxID=133385 RepID=A0A2T9YI79_9FUNG|nr:hypothetical protein BB561_004055 [Smittium simulii]
MPNNSEETDVLSHILRPSETCIKFYSGFQIINELTETEAYFAFISEPAPRISPVALFSIAKTTHTPKINNIIKIDSSLTILPKTNSEAFNNGIELAVVQNQTRKYITLKNNSKEINISFELEQDLLSFRKFVESLVLTSTKPCFTFFENNLSSWLFFYFEHNDFNEDNNLISSSPNTSKHKNNITTKNWIKQRLIMRKHEYIDLNDLKIMFFTWNVNGIDPQPPRRDHSHFDDQGNIIEQQITNYCYFCHLLKFEPDVLVYGFQELDLSPASFIYADSSKEPIWATTIENLLEKTKSNYKRVETKRLVGIFILIFCKEEVFDRISEVWTSSIGVGALGSMGNKGAVAIRIKFDETFYTFINSHLSHDDAMLDKRNFQFHEIFKRLEFENVSASTDSEENSVSSIISVFDSDLIFWFGDLNYRVDYEADKIHDLIKTKKYDLLLENDQLKTSIRYGFAFKNFEEAPIEFPPTYKYKNDTDEYNDLRSPAWTDRILWLTNNSFPYEYEPPYVVNLSYNTDISYYISDHKPVSAAFQVKTKVMNKDKYKDSMSMILKELDLLENDMKPTIELNIGEVKFGSVKYATKYTQSIELYNPGML